MSSPINISLSIIKSELIENDINELINSNSGLIKLKSIHGFGSEFKREFQYNNDIVYNHDESLTLDEHVEKYKYHIFNEIKQIKLKKINVQYNIFITVNNKYIGLSIFTNDNKYKTKINKLFDNYKNNIIQLSNVFTKQISF